MLEEKLKNAIYVVGDNQDNNCGIGYASTKRKVGFFSAIMIVIGGAIGAGIFFKQQTIMHYAQGSQLFSIFIWLVAAFGVIAMALALVEIASARNDNLSVIGWCQTFTTRYIYKMCKNYMFYIYLPKTYFYIPLYVIMSIQNSLKGFYGPNVDVSFGGHLDWLIAMFLCLGMSVYFILVAGLSSKIGNIQNIIITSVKFIPLVFAGIIGFVIIGMGHGRSGIESIPSPSLGFDTKNFQTNPNWFALMSPGIGLFISIGAIFFAYDGFYVTAGLQSEMKEPQKTPIATLIGLILVTIIYLLIAISMSVANPVDGSPYGLESWLAKYTATKNHVNWVYGLFQLLIAIGVIGIINGFAMWAPRYTEDLMRNGEIPFSYKYANRLNPHRPLVGVIYNLIISIIVIVVFSLIGGLGYIDTMNLTKNHYGQGMAGMYSFCDLIGNWNATIAFTFIVCSIIGGVINRKTKRFQTEQKSYFLPMAYASAIIVSLALFFTIFAPFINIFMLYQMAITNQLNGSQGTQEIVSRIMTIVFFAIILGVMIIPILIEDSYAKKKYGSITKYEQIKIEMIDQKINNLVY